MELPVWGVVSWQPVMITPERFHRMTGGMRQLGASECKGAGACTRQGQVLWGGATERGLVGLAWDWIEMKDDVIVMLDPMTVLSNAVFVNEHDELLDERHRILYLNNVVHDIDWQGSLVRQSMEPGVDVPMQLLPGGHVPRLRGAGPMAG